MKKENFEIIIEIAIHFDSQENYITINFILILLINKVSIHIIISIK